jgi:hypothetical protein
LKVNAHHSYLFKDYTSWNKTNPLDCNLVGIIHVMFSADSLFCGHHNLIMAYLSYTPRFAAIIPQTWPPWVILLVLWPSYLKHGLLELYSSFCGHHTSNMASSSYTPRFVDIIPPTWPPRFILLVLWPSYVKHGLLEICSSFCCHNTSNMASSSYTPRFVAIIPHGILDLYSSFCCHNTSNMASSRYTPRCVAIIPQTWPPRVILLVLWPLYLKHGLYELYLFKIEHKNILKQKAKWTVTW